MTDEILDQEVSFPLGYLLHNVNDWDAFCEETGLNPWVLNEGRALSSDSHSVSIRTLQKYNLLP